MSAAEKKPNTSEKSDHIIANMQLDKFNPFQFNASEQNIKADLSLLLSDPGLLEASIPELVDLQGQLQLAVKASGKLDKPVFDGQLNINHGQIDIPRLGLQIEQLDLKSQIKKDNWLHYQLSAKSGDGKLIVEGENQINRKTGFPGQLSLKGKNLEVINIPEARANASPDIKVSIKNRHIYINGSIDVPYAKIQPKDVSRATAVSDDVVILGDDSHAKEEKWFIHSRVRVNLGERVNFFGYGFEGRFGGSVVIIDEPSQPMTASGTITIPEGRYRAYGQRLDVVHGNILYTGGPLNNPGLDVKAVREINEISVGLTIRGHLNKPQIDLYSSPIMGQSDILAYLILGGPLDKASGEDGQMMARAALALGLSGGDKLARELGDRFGFDEVRIETNNSGDQASLVLGRYLSPKLYVSYGVGLIEALNTVRLRYQLSSKWQLKVESGEAQGADFLYTFER